MNRARTVYLWTGVGILATLLGTLAALAISGTIAAVGPVAAQSTLLYLGYGAIGKILAAADAERPTVKRMVRKAFELGAASPPLTPR